MFKQENLYVKLVTVLTEPLPATKIISLEETQYWVDKKWLEMGITRFKMEFFNVKINVSRNGD